MKLEIESIENLKNDFLTNIKRVCEHHKIDPEKLFFAEETIESIFDCIINFYKLDTKQDKTSKKALILELISHFDSSDVFYSENGFFESPIEYLMFIALQSTMPNHIFKKAFLMPQVLVCDEKYRLDIALMERRNPKVDGTEGVVIIGIECDGYDNHYGTPQKATNTLKRIREIEMTENIKVFQYTGNEIYNEFMQLAKNFWKYVEKELYYNYEIEYKSFALKNSERYILTLKDNPSKAIVNYNDMFINLETRMGPVAQYMIDLVLKLVDDIYRIQLSDYELLAIRHIWFDPKGSDMIANIDYLIDGKKKQSLNENELKTVLGNGTIVYDGIFLCVNLRIIHEDFASERFFKNSDKYYNSVD